MRRFRYFDVSVWSSEKKLFLFGLCQNGVLAPFCKDWEPIFPPNTSKRLRFPWIPLIYPQTPPDITQTPPRHIQGTGHANRQPQTPIDTTRHSQTAPVSVLGCLAVSVGVCWHVVFPGDIWGVSLGCLGGVGGYLSGNFGNWRRLDVFWGYLGSQSLQYGAKTPFWHSPERNNFFHLTILRHKNTKTATYQLCKKYWVRPFFSFFGFAREKSFVTVTFDHTVSCCRRPCCYDR